MHSLVCSNSESFKNARRNNKNTKQCDKGSKHALTVRFQPTFPGKNSDDNVNAVRIRSLVEDIRKKTKWINEVY